MRRLTARSTSAFVRLSKLINVAVLAFAGTAAFAEAPKRVVSEDAPDRVVSMNVCTDQLAMLLADEGQLVSVSSLAYDRRTSAMVEEAQNYIPNTGRAEEVFLLEPDLVIAGTYTARAAVTMLERLGIKVVTIASASSLKDVRAGILEVGAALNQTERAEVLAAEFDAGLAALQADTAARKPRAALYGANGYTVGSQTLSGEMLVAAGFINIASEMGLTHGGTLPLELLALSAPEVVITSQPYPGASRSEAVPRHPVVARMQAQAVSTKIDDGDWLCGTPFVLRAIKTLAQQRETLKP